MKKIIISLLLFASLNVAFAKRDIIPKAFPVESNVCFVGDSITHSGYYIRDITMFYVTRFPHSKINFYNVGISGDVIQHVNARMESDVLSNKPAVATLMIGMNNVRFFEKPSMDDVYLKKLNANREMFKSNYVNILNKFKNAKCSAIVLTPSIYDETMVSEKKAIIGKNGELGYFAKYIKELTKRRGLKCVDMYGYTLNFNKKFQRDFPKESVASEDRIHPRNLGGYVMMSEFIRTMKESEIVSSLDLSIDTKKLNNCFNADVSDLEFFDNAVKFTLLEYALPYALNADSERAEKYVGFAKAFNKQILKLTGLSDGTYEIVVDGKSVGKFSSKEFAVGINLGMNKNTPQYEQSLRVSKVADEYRVACNRLRVLNAVEMWQNLEKLQTAEEQIESARKQLESGKITHSYIKGCVERYLKDKAKEAELFKESRKLLDKLYDVAQPKPHKYEIKKI